MEKLESSEQTICESCGEKAHGEDIDMMYCRHCNDHATFIDVSDCPDCNGTGETDVIDTSKVNSQTIDIPYKKVKCENCNGEGWVET